MRGGGWLREIDLKHIELNRIERFNTEQQNIYSSTEGRWKIKNLFDINKILFDSVNFIKNIFYLVYLISKI